MTGGKIVLLVTGIVLALYGFGAAVGGGGLLWADSTYRGPDGYLTSPAFQLETGGYALTAEEIHLGTPSPGDWFWFNRFEVRFDVEAATEAPVFIGVAPRAEAETYLRDVAHAEVARLGIRGDDVTYRDVPGTGMPLAPEAQAFWETSAAGTGPQTMTWLTEPGSWAIVVMNADATPGVAVTATMSAQAGFLFPLGVALLIGGLLLLAVAAALVVAATAGSARAAPAGTPPVPVVPVTAGRGTYPAVIEGHLDEPLNRGLWLVKWLLVIPHVVVLVFLWTAFVLLTIVAGFAILFTGRYPRGIFDFNVGVIRWTWRVAYYSYSALGTDRYPPFTLASVDYPASFDVAYPERLSRGLVLVKWWLLAIPHLLIVGLLAGGGLAWRFDGTWGALTVGGGGGVIGLLVLVAGIIVLFRARYPQGLYDIVMGLNRWVYRVLAYVALMTDEYPPFRLDQGGPEPQPAPQPPTGPPPAEVGAELIAQ